VETERVEGWLGAANIRVVRPLRRVPGPISLRHLLSRLPEAEAEAWRAFSGEQSVSRHLGDHLLYWADGQRSLAEICRLAALETGERNETWALGFFQLLAQLDLVAGM
jgi:hypothetical protein